MGLKWTSLRRVFIQRQMDGSSGGASQPGMLPASSNIEEYIMHMLNTKVSPGLIQTCANKQAIFRRCSFYIEITPMHLHNTPLSHINPQKFELVKQDARIQVRLQIELQIALLNELRRGLEELEYIAGQLRLGNVVLSEDAIHSKISRLLDAAAEFEDALLPSTVYNRHKLFFGATASAAPQIHLKLKIKKPVIFNRANCVASSNTVILHWSIEDEKQHGRGEHFQILCKIVDPTINDKCNHLVSLTYGFYSAGIGDLLPDTLYEFTIKRLDSCFLVCSLWADVIFLKTLPDSVDC